MIVQNFFGDFEPAGMPKPIVDRLNETTQAALSDKDFGKTLSAAGFEPMPDLSPEQAKAFIKDEYVRWQAVRESGWPIAYSDNSPLASSPL